MIHFISTFFNYILGLAVIILGFFLFKKNAALKEINDKINIENDNLKEQITINEEIEKELPKAKPTKFANNSKRMHKNIL